ncbi:NUDIX hydrolase [Bacillus massiliigorillae]|uniref:NUDIX hydrolase n=1 Tax=Bacillus massiliigorillae TaxID=1243664 RepID=UPI00039E6C52|nr:NUDIX domain-containing protein [Bacillus massiliigorillae]
MSNKDVETVSAQDALKEYDVKKYETPAGYTSDIAVFTIVPKNAHSQEQVLKLMLIKRALVNGEGKPNIEGGKWALPGGFIQPDESAYEGAVRELLEETTISGVHVKHFGVYDAPGRDPRGWIISNAHYALVPMNYIELRKAADDAMEVEVFDMEEIFQLPLAFDHEVIIRDALRQVQEDMMQTTLAKEFLPKEFTLSELWHLVVSVAGEKAIESYPNFHRKAKSLSFIEEVKDVYGEVKRQKRFAKQPTKLYRFTNDYVKKSIYK